MTNNQQLQIIAKPNGPVCNLDCSYCFYLSKEKLYTDNDHSGTSSWTMPEKVLETFIKQKLQSNQVGHEYFVWQGGEPMLAGIDFFENVIKYQNKYCGSAKIYNSIQTNGILIDEKWCDFFKENNFLIGISIDGPEHIHDLYRVDKGNHPSFNKVLSAIELLKKFNIDFNTLTTVHNGNQNFPREIYNFLKEIGSTFMQFIPIVERNDQNDVSEFSVTPVGYGNFLNTIFDLWIRNDVGKIYVQNFEVALEAWFGKPSSLCIFKETCGFAPVIEHNGDMYSCDHFVYPADKIGNIMDSSISDIMNSDKQITFGMDKKNTLPGECLKCKYLFACHGECPKNRFTKTKDGEPGLNYLCEGYKMYFEHIDPAMRFMANELKNRRSPSNVMSLDDNGKS